MKKRYFTWLFLFSLALTFPLISCSKDNDDDHVEEELRPGEEEDEDEDGLEEYPAPEGPVLAFPGALGGGSYTTGGRGGSVYVVTRLDDPEFSAPPVGSLRHAVEQTGARTIVFAVSGTIQLSRPLRITKGDLTVAGQTAPGQGITLRDYPVTIDADNVIIRFIRFRMGDETATEDDALWGRNRKNIIIDHCSMSWSTDETASFYNNENFTLQWSLLSESLNMSVHDKGAHGYGGLWGGYHATFYGNILAHHKSRNPRLWGVREGVTREKTELINNVIYNWGDNSAYGGEGGSYNIINNYYKSGPGTKKHHSRIFEAYKITEYGKFYVSGNYVNGYPAVSNDNWLGMHLSGSGNINDLKMETPFDVSDVVALPAQEAYEAVLAHAGMSIYRDPVDTRVIEEIRTGTATYGGSWGAGSGIIDSQLTVGGWPELVADEAPLDSDGDGMPDAWEEQHGLNPNDPADAGRYHLSPEYTNLEVYLNELVKEKIGFGY